MVLHFLKAQNGSSLYYLTPKTEYSVGRKNCDILIGNDTSISRKHVVIYVRGDQVVLNDCASKYKTYVNGLEVEANTDVELKKGDVIKFGALNSIYKLGAIKIVTTASTLDKKENVKLSKCLEYLKGTVVRNWQDDVDFVTANHLVLTVKVLCAVIEGKPIVNLKFWDDFVMSVKNSQSIPLSENYLPQWSENTINKDVSLAYEPKRKILFKDKVFVFESMTTKNKMEAIISLTGGYSITLETSTITQNVMTSSDDKYIIINDTLCADDKSNVSLLKKIMDHLRSVGKRLIPLQEIALAIINCSCEKNCNPSFNRVASLLTDEFAFTDNQDVLAPETASECFTKPLSVSKMEVIPETVEAAMDIHPCLDSLLSVMPCDIKEENKLDVTVGLKRKEQLDDSNVPISKKSRTEFLAPSSKNASSKWTSKTTEQQKDISDVSTSLRTELSENPFADAKSFVRETSLPSSLKSTQPDGKNPFSLILNPFASSKTTPFESSQSNLFEPLKGVENSRETSKKNSTPKRSIEDTCDDKQSIKKPRTNVFFSSTQCSNDTLACFPEMSTIGESTTSNNILKRWIPVNKSIGNTTAVAKMEGLDEAKLAFIKSFEKTATIVTVDSLIAKMSITSSRDITDGQASGLKNVKKFRKSHPLKPQTYIVPKASFVTITC